MNSHYDLGIVGCWYWGNYGSLLNGYATFSIVKSFGLKPLNIISPYNGFEPHAKKFFDAVYQKEDISDLYPFERLHEFNGRCDGFLTGSDQIWNFRTKDNIRYDKYFRLDFAEDAKRKVSFATSFGNYQAEPESVYQVFRSLYERYTAISVREDEGVDILRDRYSVSAQQVMEPVLDVPTELWRELAEHSEYPKEKEPYIITYILDPTEEKRKAIQYYSAKAKMKAINILDGFSGTHERNKQKLNLPNTLPNIWCADMMKYYANSSFVITDSFHGMCFAVAFHKPFIAIGNYGRGFKRFESMMSKLGFQDRLIYDSANIPLDDKYLSALDYTHADAVLAAERERSVEWLRHSLTAPLDSFESIKLHYTDKCVTNKLEKGNCIGCGACVSACPKGALTLKPEQHGYYVSVLERDKCVNCGICSNVCPGLELPENLNKKIPDVYEFIANDDELLYRSTSGAFFTQAARFILEKKGVVVGAAWREDFTVEHIIVDNEEDLDKLRKSKYLQSYSGDIDKKVKDLLEEGRYVLFTGTPCQVAGLKKYLKKDYENLLIIDIFCGNAPSAMFFKKYVDERFGNRLKKYEFRDKSNGYSALSVRVTYLDDSEEVIFGSMEDNYQRVYHNHVMTPKHCEKCRYQSLQRYGDFSMGDFWWLDKHDKETDQSKGINLLCVNSAKAEAVLEQIPKKNIRVLKKVPYQWTGGNAQTKEGIYNGAHQQRDAFYKAILTMPFSKAVDYAMKPNHGVYPLAGERFLLHCDGSGMAFSFDRNIWEKHIINDKTVLTTRAENPPIGKYAVIPLMDHLVRNEKYILKMKYMIRTKDRSYSFHIKDSGSNIYQEIYTFRGDASRMGVWIEKEIEFTSNADFFDEFMIGAAQLRGNDAYISFDYIYIVKP